MSARPQILIVDDRPENLLALRRVLAEVDAEVVEAGDGNAALAATLHHDFALAFVEVLLRGLDGYDLAPRRRGAPRTARLPIVFLTAGSSEQEQVFKGYEAGAVDFLVKPYAAPVLLSKVRVFLELHLAQTELADKVNDLAASEERFRGLVMTVPDIVYRTDPDGRFSFLNDAVQGLGYMPAELIGRHFATIISPDDAESVSRALVLPPLSGQATGPEGAPLLFDERRAPTRHTMGLEVRLRPRGGAATADAEPIGEVSSSGLYARLPGQRQALFLGTVGVIRDVTARKRVERELAGHREHLEVLVQQRTTELAASNKEIQVLNVGLEQRVVERTAELSAANRELDAFAYAVSHDLRAPLRAVAGFSEILRSEHAAGLDVEAKRCLDNVISNAAHMGSLIDGLLSLSRATRGELSREWVDLTALCRHRLEELAAAEPQRRVAADVQPGLQARGDPRLLDAVMRNLLDNAWKYTGRTEATQIRVYGEQRDGRDWVCVADNGAGFDMAYADRLFRPFQRLHRDAEFPGIGIGLATVRRIVHRHGGVIEAEAQPGQGALFRFCLETPGGPDADGNYEAALGETDQ